MVSQPTMQRILGLPTRLFGLTAALLLFTACGQNEGGRCQVNSDCASGLICSDTSGNGTCRNPSLVGTNDAALKSDVAQDDVASPTEDAPSPSSEVGAEAMAMPGLDAESVDAGTADSAGLDSAEID